MATPEELRRRVEQLSPEKRTALLRKLRSQGFPVPLTWAADLGERTSRPDLSAEAQLEDAIGPTRPPPGVVSPSTALLTGATGFLGAFLLRELTALPDQRVLCLVRCESPAGGMERIRQNLARYGLTGQVDLGRVSAVVGKLDAPRLGLSEPVFQALANEVDTVYHNGAMLNFLYGYEPFIGPNVVGTQEVLRFACTGTTKRVNHVSTVFFFMYGAHPENPAPVDEATPLQPPPPAFGGYAQSKYVAERLVWSASKRGLPVSVFRPGLVVGSSQTGACSAEEIFVRYLEGLPKLGVFPSYPFPLTGEVGCVDFVAKAIVALGTRDAALGRAFHLFTEEPGEQHAVTAGPLLARGFPLEQVDYAKWLSLLRTSVIKQRDNPLQPLVPFLTDEWPGTPSWTFHETIAHRPRISSRATMRELEALGIPCPSPLEAGEKTVDWLMAQGRLKPPA